MDNCIFCKIIAGEIPCYKVYEDEFVLAFFDIYPAAEYHTLVIPKAHFVNMFDVPEEESAHIMRAIKKIVKLYEDKLGLKNLQVLCSSGTEAQQEIMHLHYHIVPRALGDGQNVKWATHPEWEDRFSELLEKLR
ncbi:MAG: HIT family protein [Firmicutes bacterium]|nr:HIT family protein [Bacillota bacterium]